MIVRETKTIHIFLYSDCFLFNFNSINYILNPRIWTNPLYFCIWCGGFWKLYFVNPNLAPRTQILIPFRTLPHLSMTLTHFLCSFFLFVTLNFNKITIEIDNFIFFHWSCTWCPIVYVHVVLHLMRNTAIA